MQAQIAVTCLVAHTDMPITVFMNRRTTRVRDQSFHLLAKYMPGNVLSALMHALTQSSISYDVTIFNPHITDEESLPLRPSGTHPHSRNVRTLDW